MKIPFTYKIKNMGSDFGVSNIFRGAKDIYEMGRIRCQGQEL